MHACRADGLYSADVGSSRYLDAGFCGVSGNLGKDVFLSQDSLSEDSGSQENWVLTMGDFTFWIISVLILEYKIIINLADEFRSYPVVRIDIRIIRKLN